MAFGAPAKWYDGKVFGLPIIMVCMLGMMAQIGPIIYNAFGFFASAMEDQYGWGRGDMYLSLTIVSIAIFLVHPPAGFLIDRFGVKRVLIPSLLLLTLAYALTGLFVSELWHLYLGLAAASVLGVGANSIFYIRTISQWFDKNRGLVLGVVAAGAGLGVALIPPAIQQIIDAGSWRDGFYALALLNLVIVIPMLLLFLRDKPVDIGLTVDGKPQDEDGEKAALTGLTAGQAVKTPTFWLLLFAIGLSVFALYGVSPNLALILKDRGLTTDQAGQAAMVLGIGMFLSRLGVGILMDRIFAPTIGLVVFIMAAGGFGLLAYGGDSVPLLLLAALLIGIGIGAEVDLIGFMVGRYFGLRAFGSIYGLVFLGFLAGTATGVLVVASSGEAQGSFVPILTILMGLTLFTALLFPFMGRYERYRDRFTTAEPEAPAPAHQTKATA